MTRAPVGAASTSLHDFQQLALLGEGAYSAVYKVLRLADSEVYALKKVKLPSLSEKERQNALNEVRLLASVRHENVIAYKEAFFDDKTRSLCIVTECADQGDLLQQINKCKKERNYIRETDIWRYLFGMCLGLKALHDLRILHRDMKSANVFLCSSSRDSQTIAKLGDFNVSKVAKRGLCMTQTGTPYYASPEVWRDMPYDAKSDIWSLGCVVYEMVALRPPFRAEDMEGLYRKVVRGLYPRIPPHYSQDLSEVIAALLQVHPRHRPSIEQLLQMPVMHRHSPDFVNEMGACTPSDLLQTIKVPKNSIDLSGCLPKPRYEELPEETAPSSTENAGGVGGPSAAVRLANALSMAANTNSAGTLPQSGHRKERERHEGLGGPGPPGPPVASPPAEPPSHEAVPDSLDAYLQQQHLLQQQQPQHLLPQQQSTPSQEQVQRRQQQQQQQQQQPQQLEELNPSHHPIHPPNSEGTGAHVPPPSPLPPGAVPRHHGAQPLRQHREARRPMSIYARQQLAVCATPQHPAPEPSKQPGRGGNRLRLAMPKIF